MMPFTLRERITERLRRRFRGTSPMTRADVHHQYDYACKVIHQENNRGNLSLFMLELPQRVWSFVVAVFYPWRKLRILGRALSEFKERNYELGRALSECQERNSQLSQRIDIMEREAYNLKHAEYSTK